MITNVSFPQSAVIRSSNQAQPSPSPAPTPDPQPAPAPPTESFDLSSIDCPYKVAQLPILEPAFQLAMAGAVAAAFLSAMGGGGVSPAITVGVGSMIGDSAAIGGEYKFDLNNQQNPVTSEGVVANEAGEIPTAGSLTFNQQAQTVEWNGTIGNNAEHLTFKLNEDQANPGINMAGQVGSVPLNLNFGLLGTLQDVQSNPTGAQGYTVSGTVGDLPYKTENRFTIDESSLPTQAPAVGSEFTFGSMAVRGSIGDREISKDYEIGGSVESATSVALYAAGQGTNAGQAQQVIGGILVENLPEGIFH